MNEDKIKINQTQLFIAGLMHGLPSSLTSNASLETFITSIMSHTGADANTSVVTISGQLHHQFTQGLLSFVLVSARNKTGVNDRDQLSFTAGAADLHLSTDGTGPR